MIQASAVNVSSLPRASLSDRRTFPELSCVYLAVDKFNAVQYVGLASNLRTRWASHHRLQQLQNMGDIKIAWLQVPDVELLEEIEKVLINHFNPVLNRKTTWFLSDNPLKWRMCEIMARYRISNKELAQELGRSPTSISHLKNSDTMPRMDGHELGALCLALSRLASLDTGKQVCITHLDLFEYVARR